MAGERRIRILQKLVGQTNSEFDTKRLCEVCAEVTGMSGAGIMLMSGDEPRGSVCTSDKVSAALEELQFALGEGPCIDAFRNDRPVAEPHLAQPTMARWLAFTPSALEAGAHAVFGFPLQVGAIRLGALNLYRDTPGPLNDEQHADALVMADVAAQALLVLQADAIPGELASKLEEGADFKYVVHQATGMIAVQLGVGVPMALVRLRAHAFGNDLSLTAVAEDVVARRLHFKDDHDEGERI